MVRYGLRGLKILDAIFKFRKVRIKFNVTRETIQYVDGARWRKKKCKWRSSLEWGNV